MGNLNFAFKNCHETEVFWKTFRDVLFEKLKTSVAILASLVHFLSSRLNFINGDAGRQRQLMFGLKYRFNPFHANSLFNSLLRLWPFYTKESSFYFCTGLCEHFQKFLLYTAILCLALLTFTTDFRKSCAMKALIVSCCFKHFAAQPHKNCTQSNSYQN